MPLRTFVRKLLELGDNRRCRIIPTVVDADRQHIEMRARLACVSRAGEIRMSRADDDICDWHKNMGVADINAQLLAVLIGQASRRPDAIVVRQANSSVAVVIGEDS